MGLEEKRMARDIREQLLPETRTKLKELAGFDIGLEINLDEILQAPNAYDALRMLYHYQLASLVSCFESICRGQFEQDLVQQAIDTIHIQHQAGYQGEAIKYNGKQLELTWDFSETYVDPVTLETQIGKGL
jgi:hypothetical protein